MATLTYQKKYAIVVTPRFDVCFQVRFGNWMHYLNGGAGGECEIIATTTPIFDERILAHTASVTFQRFTGAYAMDIKRLAALKKKLHFDIVLDYDDILFACRGKSPIPGYNQYNGDVFAARRAIADILPFVDRITLSTASLALAFIGEFHLRGTDHVQVVPNFAFTTLAWDEKRPRRKRPLVVYTGATSHYSKDDLGDLAGPWIPAITQLVGSKAIEFHAFGPDKGPFPDKTVLHPHAYASQWLSTLSRLAPDVIIAPLAANLFNSCKSDIKALEAGLVGAAFIGGAFPGSPYNKFLTADTAVLGDDTPERVAELVVGAGTTHRDQIAEFVGAQVVNNGLVAESKPATDLFIKALFGEFVHAT